MSWVDRSPGRSTPTPATPRKGEGSSAARRRNPEFIQALWVIAIPLTALGVTWLALRGLAQILTFFASRRHRCGHLIYGVYQDEQGRWMVYWHNRKPQEIDWSNPPPELIGRGEVIRGAFRRPQE